MTKKLMSKIVAYMIAVAMVITLIPVMPASAAERDLEISIQGNGGWFVVTMNGETWTTTGCGRGDAVEGYTAKQMGYTRVITPSHDQGKTFEGWCGYYLNKEKRAWLKLIDANNLTEDEMLNYVIPADGLMFQAKWSGESLPDSYGWAPEEEQGLEGGMYASPGTFTYTSPGEIVTTGNCSRRGFEEGMTLKDNGYMTVTDPIHPNGLYFMGWLPYKESGDNWVAMEGEELLTTAEMLDWKFPNHSVLFYAQWSEDPWGTEGPTEPEEPSEPENPTEPDQPTTPDEPVDPNQPTTPDDPSDTEDSNDEDVQVPTSSVAINKQNFPDDNFRAELARYDSNDDGVFSVEELQEIWQIAVEDKGIESLEGIHLLPCVTELYCGSNFISELPELPNELKELRCYNNDLTELSNLPDTIEYIDCQDNYITQMANLPANLKELYCDNNRLKVMPELPSKLVILDCTSNQLESFTNLPDSIEKIYCNYNNVTSLPKLPANLVELWMQENQLKTLPALPDKLRLLACFDNDITNLPKVPKTLETINLDMNEVSGFVDLSNGVNLKTVALYDNKITGVKLCPEANYQMIDVSYNYMNSTADVTGNNKFEWSKETNANGRTYTFYKQKGGCERYGHSYKTIKTVKATTSKNGYIRQKCTRCNGFKDTTLYKISSIKLSTAKYTYNGKVKKPSVTVKDSKGNTISSKYYTVSYAKGRKSVGKYKVTVKFKTRYSGTKTAYFTIVPKAPSSASAALYGYDDVKFSWKKSTGAKGYSVYYKTATGSYKLLTRTTKTSVKKANLSDGIKYTFKVVPYYKSGSTRYDALTSKTASVYTLKKIATPVVEKYNNSQVRVKWTDIDGQSGYQISKSTSKTKTNIVSTFATTTGQNKLLKATKNKKYYYKVRAYKKVGKTKIYGPWSSVKAYTLSNKVETVKINITKDNVDKYFEVKELITWRSNVLGETNSLWYEYHICLKDEYVKRLAGYSPSVNYDEGISISNDSRILFEYKWDNKRYYPTVDYEKKTYSFVESDIPPSEYDKTSRTEECYGWFDKECNRWIVASGGCSYSCLDKVEDYPEGFTVSRKTNFEFTRASGTLILTK